MKPFEMAFGWLLSCSNHQKIKLTLEEGQLQTHKQLKWNQKGTEKMTYKKHFSVLQIPLSPIFFFFFSSLPASLQGPLLAVEAHIWILWANTSKRTTQWRPLKAPPERDDGGLHEARCFLPLPSSCHGCYGIWRSRGRGENTTFVISLRNFTLNLFFCCPSSTLAILLMFNCCVGLQYHDKNRL